mgnify:FL=1
MMAYKKGLQINMLLLIIGILILACLMTYIIPAGQYEVDSATKQLLPGTFHYIVQTPVNLWQTLCNIFDGMVRSAKVMSIVIFMGGALRVIINTNAMDDFMKWCIFNLQKKGVYVIVPLMVILFSILSAYGGNDSFWLLAFLSG